MRGWGQNCGIFRFVIFSFVILILLEEIPDKMKLSPSTLEKLCYTPWNFQNQDLLDHHCPRNANSFLIYVWNFHICFFNIPPRNFKSSTLPLFGFFFWNTSSCYATKIVIWFFGWNSPVHWAIPKKNTNRWGLVDILFWKPPGIFRFVTLTSEIMEKTSFYSLKIGNSAKLCATLWKFQRSKTKTQGNFTLVFL